MTAVSACMVGDEGQREGCTGRGGAGSAAFVGHAVPCAAAAPYPVPSPHKICTTPQLRKNVFPPTETTGRAAPRAAAASNLAHFSTGCTTLRTHRNLPKDFTCRDDKLCSALCSCPHTLSVDQNKENKQSCVHSCKNYQTPEGMSGCLVQSLLPLFVPGHLGRTKTTQLQKQGPSPAGMTGHTEPGAAAAPTPPGGAA
eukprot:scaffold449_cov17-Tisochrysis_lutea.AAC.1